MSPVESIFVSQRGDLGRLVRSNISTRDDLIDSQASGEDADGISLGHLFELDGDIDPEEFIEVEETASDTD